MERRDAVVLGVLPILLSAVAAATDHGELACNGAKVYPAPTDSPIEHAVVLVRDARISSIGTQGESGNDLPRAVPRLECAGKVVVAGFWNSHVAYTIRQGRIIYRKSPER